MSHEKNLEIGLLLDYYKGFLTDNQKKVLDYYYNEDYSLSEIAAQLGISRQGAQDNIARSQKKLLDMEQKLGLLKKTTASARALEAAMDTLRQAPDFPGREELEAQLQQLKQIWEDKDGI